MCCYLGFFFPSVVVTAFHFHLKISKHPLPLQDAAVSSPIYFEFRRLIKTNSLWSVKNDLIFFPVDIDNKINVNRERKQNLMETRLPKVRVETFP